MNEFEPPLSTPDETDKDIETLRRENAELERSFTVRNEELEATNKELESFTYSVSHDLRAPLRSILGYANILLEDYGEVLDDEGKRVLRRQIDAAHRMERLIADLLEYSRLGRRELLLSEFDMSKLAREIADEICRRPWNCETMFDIEEGLRVCADPGLMRFVLHNLFENAVKYSVPKGSAKVRFGRRPDNVYFVKDEGIGFDMSFVGNLFKPFERLHNAAEFPGTGIGLTNVQRVIHRHGGKVWAESNLNQGATFYFTLGDRQG